MPVGPPNAPGGRMPFRYYAGLLRQAVRRPLFPFLSFASALCGIALLDACAGEPAGPATPPVASTTIPNSYIVVFRRDVSDPPGLARQLVTAAGGTLRHTYGSAIKGFAADLPARAVEALQHNPHVAYVEQDQVVELFGGGTEPAPPAPWGLDRVDQRTLPLGASYTWGTSG